MGGSWASCPFCKDKFFNSNLDEGAFNYVDEILGPWHADGHPDDWYDDVGNLAMDNEKIEITLSEGSNEDWVKWRKIRDDAMKTVSLVNDLEGRPYEEKRVNGGLIPFLEAQAKLLHAAHPLRNNERN